MLTQAMKVLQVLPNLDSGGVERGVLDFARTLKHRGHESIVISAGGRMVDQLTAEGSQHIHFPVHQKSLKSLLRVRRLRQLILSLNVDIIHVRSRIPAWMVWLALKGIPIAQRPGLVSTFHGLYSVSPYSAIMGCGDRVIAISHCVHDYITKNYRKIDQNKLRVVHRGVDTREFNRQKHPDTPSFKQVFGTYPALQDKPLIVMPGRLSRWKGQELFIDLIADLKRENIPCHGLIVGEPTPGKDHYLNALKQRVIDADVNDHITFLGHRNDMPDIYRLASLVCNLSLHPEPFGRTVIESLAIGTPVLAFDCGGPSESLQECLPQGLVPVGDRGQLLETAKTLLNDDIEFTLPDTFTLERQADVTLGIYEDLLSERSETNRTSDHADSSLD